MRARTAFLRTSLGRRMRHKQQMRSYSEKKAKEVAEQNFPELTSDEIAEVVKDMMNEGLKYNVTFDEYIMYHFKDRDFESRRQFIPTRERALYCERINKPKNQMIFDDKGKTFEVFGKYFKRDLISVTKNNKKTAEQFKAFVEKHPRFIIKPFNGGNGRGIRIVDISEAASTESLYSSLRAEHKDGFVAEELIIQCKELAAPHPQSVNTLRVFTVRFDDRVEFLPFAWRVGRGDSCVDNGGSGGIFCALNDEGEVIATSDEKGRSYEVHPDTGHKLIGFKVPRFEEAKAFAKELAMVVPSNRYCGWDIALTDNGWVMQEGNWQGGIVAFQCPLQRGYRTEMDAIMKELNV